MRNAGFLLLLAMLAGCAAGPAPVGQKPDPASVKSLALRLAPANLETLSPGQKESIRAKIAGNLQSWGYPVRPDAQPGPETSHILEAGVSPPAVKSLPPGFNFSLGSDDMRAPERQKTRVVTVSCAIRPAAGKGGGFNLSGDFQADGGGQHWFGGESDADREYRYVDRLGSVCLNLLNELRVAKEKPKDAALAPAWMPEMRIEIKTKEGPSKPGLGAAPKPAHAPAETPALPAAAPPSAQTAAPAKPVSKPEQKPAEKPAIETEERTGEGEGRKQLIIHNQGTPVILEFGYDRDRGMGQ